MNSYNDNLHASVVASLNAQELELQKLKTQKDAATFSMYYAQGARITAAEKLEITTDKYEYQQNVNTEAVIDSDLSTNVLTSANNVKAYVAKSVTNTAVAASNVQIAANAILKLASNVGSIFSIVNAADFGTDIYNQAEEVKKHMDTTAYKAEKTSQHSMEASSLIAEVSATVLADKATVADTSVKDLLKTVSTQLAGTTEELSTETNNLATANTKEKKSEGDLEDVNAVYHASEKAYDLAKKELNLSLNVNVVPEIEEDDIEDMVIRHIGDETNYTVEFNSYKAPFQGLFKEKTTVKPSIPKQYNVVEDYYIMLVKISKKSTFSISEAEGLLSEGKAKQFIKIPQEEYETILNNQKKITTKIFTSELLDSDGDKMSLGKEYVVFVFAEFRNKYKKLINSFDNYLSAASTKFILTNQLNSPETSSIIVTPNGKLLQTVKESEDKSIETVQQVLSFNVWESKNYISTDDQNKESKVNYRCFFLPHNPSLIKGLLTVYGLKSIESETEGIEKIADKYDPKIASTKSEITSRNAEVSGLISQIEIDNGELKSNKTKQKKKDIQPKELKELKAQEVLLEANILKLTKDKQSVDDQLTKLKKQLMLLELGKTTAIKKLEEKVTNIKPGFYFNLLTAEQVPAGSYTVADSVPNTTLKKLSAEIIAIINNVKNIEEDYSILKSDIDAFNKKTNQFIQSLNNKKNLDTIKKNVVNELEKIKTIVSDIKALGRDVLKLIDSIIDLVIKAINENVLVDLLTDLQTLIAGWHYLVKGYVCSKKQMIVKPETTDNFGNRLINNNEYIPAILSIKNGASVEEDLQFTNALSDFKITKNFIYKTTNEIALIDYKTVNKAEKITN